jgi:chromosome segregation ATPase
MSHQNSLLEQAEEIAKMLKQIQDAEREKITLQNKLTELTVEQNGVKEQINRIDSLITSTKYSITNRVNESVKLTVVKTED